MTDEGSTTAAAQLPVEEVLTREQLEWLGGNFSPARDPALLEYPENPTPRQTTRLKDGNADVRDHLR